MTQLQLAIDTEALNAAGADYRQIDVRPLGGALGAEILGVDLSSPLTDEAMAEIRRAFHDHLVIFFRDQDITPDELKRFGSHFGTFHIHPYVSGTVDDHPEIMLVRKTKSDKLNFGGTWHSDVTFETEPPLGSILYALEVPEYGGDTLFANMYLAYEMLSDAMQAMLAGLHAVHSAKEVYGRQGVYAKDDFQSGMQGTEVKVDQSIEDSAVHPVVRTHPETGRKGLFVNRPFTQHFRGMTERESAPLLEFLCQHSTMEDFTCRFRWTVGTAAFWDNRCTQHYALNDYPGRTRVMHRLTINGDRPV